MVLRRTAFTCGMTHDKIGMSHYEGDHMVRSSPRKAHVEDLAANIESRRKSILASKSPIANCTTQLESQTHASFANHS